MVDRFKVRPDLATRLAESFETALELSGGTAVVANMDDPKAEELLFSANFACPHCGYSVPELEPRLFSFNNPAGACRLVMAWGFSNTLMKNAWCKIQAFP